MIILDASSITSDGLGVVLTFHWFCAMDKDDLPPETDITNFDSSKPGKVAVNYAKYFRHIFLGDVKALK